MSISRPFKEEENNLIINEITIKLRLTDFTTLEGFKWDNNLKAIGHQKHT